MSTENQSRGEKQPLPDEFQLAKFILLRWDQIDELVFHLRDGKAECSFAVDVERLSKALRLIGDHRLAELRTYLDYLDSFQYARRDYQRWPVYAVRDPAPEATLPGLERTETGIWLKCEGGVCPEVLEGYRITRLPSAEVQIVLA